MATDRVDLPQGTLDLLILRTLALQPQHDVPQGSLYPALHRLERRGWIKAEWGISDNNRRAKYDMLTPKGRKQLDAEAESWRKLTTAVGLVMQMK